MQEEQTGGSAASTVFELKKKNWMLSFASSPVERAAVAGETRARLAGPRGGGPRWGKESVKPRG